MSENEIEADSETQEVETKSREGYAYNTVTKRWNKINKGKQFLKGLKEGIYAADESGTPLEEAMDELSIKDKPEKKKRKNISAAQAAVHGAKVSYVVEQRNREKYDTMRAKGVDESDIFDYHQAMVASELLKSQSKLPEMAKAAKAIAKPKAKAAPKKKEPEYEIPDEEEEEP